MHAFTAVFCELALHICCHKVYTYTEIDSVTDQANEATFP